jgi:Zinc knuckle
VHKNPNIVCWKCNQKGHIQYNCPKNNLNKENGMVASKKDKNKDSESEASFIAIEKTTQNSNLWIGNRRFYTYEEHH